MTAQANFHHESPPCTVLYVEDDDATAHLFQKALAEENVRLRLFRVTNGQDGLAFLRREGTYVEAPTPDLIVLDINLPKKNGFEVLEEAQQMETLRRVPKVMFSSSTSAADRQRAQTLGAHKFLIKDGWDSFVATAKLLCSMLHQESR
jgi:CheY-like chemotaxis protein